MSQAAPTRAFEPARYATFRFTGWTFDEPSATASLSYALDDDLHFTERIALPAGAPPLDGARRAALHAVLDLLHQVAGVSYYKTAAPRAVAVGTGPLAARRARLLTDVYTKGLGEYAYRNELPHARSAPALRRPTVPPVRPAPRPGATDAPLVADRRRQGLDRHAGDPARGRARPGRRSRSTPTGDLRVNRGLRPAALAARRRLDPLLFDLNADGALQRPHPGHRDQLADRGRHRACCTGSARW